MERSDWVLAKAVYVFDDEVAAQLWMDHPHLELGGQSPAEACGSDQGARRAAYILDSLFYGLPV